MAFTLAAAYVELKQRGFREVSSAISETAKTASSLAKGSLTEVTSRVTGLTTPLANAANYVTTLGRTMVTNLGGAISKVSGPLVKISKDVTSFVTGPLTSLGSKALSVARSFGPLNNAIMALGLTAGVGGMLKLAADAETAAISMEVLLGSADKAAKMIADLKAYGAATPFEFADLQDAAKVMLGFGIEAGNIMSDLDMLGNVASGNKNKLASLALVFGQISAGGKLTGGDLLQLINVGFNPLNQIAKRTGESISEVKDRMSQGNVAFAEVRQAFVDATSAGGLFYKMNERIGATLGGLWSTLQDSMTTILTEIGQAMVEAFDLKTATINITTFANGFQTHYLPAIKMGLQATATRASGICCCSN